MRNLAEVTATLTRLAARQHGLFTHAQAIAAGLNRMTLSRRVRSGTWREIHPRVFGTGVQSLEQRALAACLWLGPDALLSHRSAARLWGIFQGTSTEPLEVTTDNANFRTTKAVVVHRSGALKPEDRRVRRVIPVTSVARTLIDLASCLEPLQLAYAVEAAWRQHLVSPDWVERRLHRVGQGRKGATALYKILADCRRRGRPLDSALEVRLWFLLKRAKLDRALPGYEFRDDFGQPGRIDFAFPSQRLAVEADGFEFHGDRAAFERDRLRMARLAALGWRVLPVTWRQLDEQPTQVLERIRRALAARDDVTETTQFDDE